MSFPDSAFGTVIPTAMAVRRLMTSKYKIIVFLPETIAKLTVCGLWTRLYRETDLIISQNVYYQNRIKLAKLSK